MKVISKSGVEAMLQNIEDSVAGGASPEVIEKIVHFYRKYVEDEAWDDPDYSLTRQAKIAKKIDGKWIPIDELR